MHFLRWADEIDGPSGILGFGGPLWMDSYNFPRTSYMVFDVDDIQSLKDESSWSSLVRTYTLLLQNY